MCSDYWSGYTKNNSKTITTKIASNADAQGQDLAAMVDWLTFTDSNVQYETQSSTSWIFPNVSTNKLEHKTAYLHKSSSPVR